MLESDICMLISIFCDIDDFCKEFEPEWRKILIENQDKFLIGDKKRRNRKSVNNKLKADCQIEHHRHRSPWNFFVNLISGIVSYAYNTCKPSIRLTRGERNSVLRGIINYSVI